MRWLSLAVLLCVPASTADAQRCGTVACEIEQLHVTPDDLASEATRIVTLRRQAEDARASAGRRVAALRRLAERLADVAGRARGARALGGLTPDAIHAFERVAGLSPLAASAATRARQCVDIARRAHAWGEDAELCLSISSGAWAPIPLRVRLAFPGVSARWREGSDGDDAARAYEATLARVRSGGDMVARIALGAMLGAMGECESARDVIATVPIRTYEERLLRADILACLGRTSEAVALLRDLAREAPRRFEAVHDLALVLAPEELDAARARPRAELALLLAAAQTSMCNSPNAVDRLGDEDIQDIAQLAATALGLDTESRPILPTRYLGSWHIDQERGRPLGTCSSARRALTRGRIAFAVAARDTAPCGTTQRGVLAALDPETHDLAIWGLRAGRVVRLREANDCDRDVLMGTATGPTENAPDGIDAMFALGDVNGDGTAETALVAPWIRDGLQVGREVRVVDRGAAPGARRVIDVLRREATRFGTSVSRAGDLDGDGTTDLLVTSPTACDCCHDCSDSPDELFVYLGSRSGRFRPMAAPVRGPDGIQNWIRALPLGDVDGDRLADVLVAHGAQIRLHRGTRGGLDVRGTLLRERHGDAISSGIALGALGDTDGDGLAEAWWIDSDAGEAFRLRGARHRQPALERLRLSTAQP